MKSSVFLFFSVVLLCGFSAHASNIEEVTGKSGVKAWLVEDHKLPLISLHIAFRGGVEQDPFDKQGLANLTMNALTEGGGPYDADTFQQKLADHSIAMNFNAGRDALYGTIKTLSSEKEETFALLQLVLTKPRFDEKDIERERSQQLATLRVQLGNPDWQARYALFQKIFGDHPYGSRRLGTTETLARLTRNDISSFAARHIARDNLVVAVAGDITARDLSTALDQMFGDLPRHAQLSPVSEVAWPLDTATILTPREGTQTALLFAMPGPKRDDPDWYAAEIANYILGGGGFSSRLMQEVRDINGLTYDINTTLSAMEHGGLLTGEAATDNPKTGKAWEIILDTMHHFYEDGAKEKDVKAAKDYLTGALPLSMTSTDKITRILLEWQLDRLGPDYLDRRNDLIRNVTVEDVDRVIRRWFNPDRLTLSMVGKPENIVPTQTKELIQN
jgi:zinc protease